MKHYGVDHCRAVGLFETKKGVEDSDSATILKLYRQTCGFEEFPCPERESEVTGDECNNDQGSRIAWLHHLSTEHYFKKLVRVFKKYTTKDKNVSNFAFRKRSVQKLRSIHREFQE